MGRIYVGGGKDVVVGRIGRGPRVGGFDDDEDGEDEDYRQLPARQSSTAIAQRSSGGLQLPFDLTWERLVLIVIVIWLLYKFVTRAAKGDRKIKRLTKMVKALSAEKRTIIDIDS